LAIGHPEQLLAVNSSPRTFFFEDAPRVEARITRARRDEEK
jgi:hypothetical protein